jgi:hypothetical protein
MDTKLSSKTHTINDLPLWVRQWLNFFGYIPEKWFMFGIENEWFNFTYEGDKDFYGLCNKSNTPWDFNRS